MEDLSAKFVMVQTKKQQRRSVLEVLENNEVWGVRASQKYTARPPQEHTDFEGICKRDEIHNDCLSYEQN